MAVAHVQNANQAYGSFATLAIPFAGNVTAGSTLAIYGFITSTTPVLVSVTDSRGQTWVAVDEVAGSSGKAITAYFKNTSAGACTVTVAFDSQNFSTWLAIEEISGTDTAAPLNAHKMTPNENPGTGTDLVTSGTDTTTVNGCYIFGGTAEPGFGSAITVGTGFTLRNNGTTDGRTTEELIQSSAGVIAATFTSNSSGADYVTGMMAFKPSGGGAETITLDKWFSRSADVIRRKIGVVPSGTIGIKS
jgi:hypothetical protein